MEIQMNEIEKNQKIISEYSTFVAVASQHAERLELLLKTTVSAAESISIAYDSNEDLFRMMINKLEFEFGKSCSNYIKHLEEFYSLNKKSYLDAGLRLSKLSSVGAEHKGESKSLIESWTPRRDNGFTPDFKNISVFKIPNYTADSLERLKKSMFGRFYNRHLKKHALTRYALQHLYRVFFPIILGYKLRKNRYIRVPIVSQAEFIEINKIQKSVIFHGDVLETPNPKVTSFSGASILRSPHAFYQVPEIYLFEIKNAKVNAESNFIFSNNQAIVHDLYNFHLDYTSEELHNRLVINLDKNEASDLTADINVFELDSAISFLDSCASNYSHWLTEVLPRVASYCNTDYDEKIPMLINANLHSNIKESLFSIVKPGTRIYEIPKGRSLSIKNLRMISVAGYVPFERRKNSNGNYSHGVFFPEPIKCIRNNLINLSEINSNTPKKIYIRRNSGIRQVINIEEIEIILKDHDFVFVEPEKLTFLEQVSLFSQADIVIGSSGAAMANLIFMKPDAAVVILIGEYVDTSYWYWANMAYASGLSNFNYVIGQQIEGSIHSNFFIDIISFQKTLNRL